MHGASPPRRSRTVRHGRTHYDAWLRHQGARAPGTAVVVQPISAHSGSRRPGQPSSDPDSSASSTTRTRPRPARSCGGSPSSSTRCAVSSPTQDTMTRTATTISREIQKAPRSTVPMGISTWIPGRGGRSTLRSGGPFGDDDQRLTRLWGPSGCLRHLSALPRSVARRSGRFGRT